MREREKKFSSETKSIHHSTFSKEEVKRKKGGKSYETGKENTTHKGRENEE